MCDNDVYLSWNFMSNTGITVSHSPIKVIATCNMYRTNWCRPFSLLLCCWKSANYTLLSSSLQLLFCTHPSPFSLRIICFTCNSFYCGHIYCSHSFYKRVDRTLGTYTPSAHRLTPCMHKFSVCCLLLYFCQAWYTNMCYCTYCYLYHYFYFYIRDQNGCHITWSSVQ